VQNSLPFGGGVNEFAVDAAAAKGHNGIHKQKQRAMKQIQRLLLFVVAVISLAVNAHAGRWLSRDPMEVQEHMERDPHPFLDLNPYTFVRNNPLHFVDPFGLDSYVVNAGGYTGHTSFVVDNPAGGVIAYHFFAEHHGGDAPWYMQDMGLFYDGVHIWSQYANSLEDYLANEGKIYGSLDIGGVGVGTTEDDARAIQRLDQEMKDQEGYYSLLGGRECHKQSWDWFHDYTWGGRDVPTSQMQGLKPLLINGQVLTPPNKFTLTPAFLMPQLPSFGPMQLK